MGSRRDTKYGCDHNAQVKYIQEHERTQLGYRGRSLQTRAIVKQIVQICVETRAIVKYIVQICAIVKYIVQICVETIAIVKYIVQICVMMLLYVKII